MSVIEFIQKFFLLLLPGVVGILLYNKINNIREEKHYYLEILKLICLSVASFMVTDVFFCILNFIPVFHIYRVDIIREIGASEINLPTANVVAAVVAAVLIVYLLTIMNDEEWLSEIAERLSEKRRERIRREKEAVWELFFDKGNVVVLRDYVTKNIYYGIVEASSEDGKQRKIMLGDVSVFSEDAKFLYRAEWLYITRDHNQFSVEIQTGQDESESPDGEKEGVVHGSN